MNTANNGVKNIQLNDGNTIPQLGLGVWQLKEKTAIDAVSSALHTGYRHIDTAAIYENETEVGKAIEASGIAREDIFLTTKLWNTDQGYESALKAFDASLKRLNTDYVNLYLIHWPVPEKDLYLDSWRALIKLKESGLVKSIGVSNFRKADLERLIKETDIVPVLNQIELHPLFQQHELRELHKKFDIVTEAWSPLGQGKNLEDEALKTIARAHKKSVAQIILRWQLEIGNIAIPRSSSSERIKENFDIFDFNLTSSDLETIGNMDTPNGRIGPDPSIFG